MEMPMLDETEFAEVAKLYSAAIKGVKHFRETTGSDLKHPTVSDFFSPVRKKYEQLTGMRGLHENAIMHHRIVIYGPPCARCGKPLRTAKARLCANCGVQVAGSET